MENKQSNKTIITFKALRRGVVVYKNIPIHHNFQELPETEFNGIKFPSTSIETQVIQYLDEIDKSDIMNQYEFDVILDYFPKKKRVKRNEVEEFIKFCKPCFEVYPHLIRPFNAVISESKEILFGKRKSNYQKFKEVLNMVGISFKIAGGTIDVITKIIKQHNDINRIKYTCD